MEWEGEEVSGEYGGARAVWEERRGEGWTSHQHRAAKKTQTSRRLEGGEKKSTEAISKPSPRASTVGTCQQGAGAGKTGADRSLKELWQLEALHGSLPASARLGLIALPH